MSEYKEWDDDTPLDGQISFFDDEDAKEAKEPEEDIQEDTGLTDADRKWLDERDKERQPYTGGDVSQEVSGNIDNYYHNKDSESITFGGYADEDGNKLPETYIEAAERTHSAYFSNDNYDKIQQEGNHSKKEMYKESGNEDVVEKALDNNQELQFTDDPYNAGGATEQEKETIQRRTGEDVDDFKKEEDGLYHKRDYNSYYDEQPLDTLDDEEWN